MKLNNKTLGITFAALLLIYLLTKIFSGNKERSFDPQIISIDTSSITKIMVDPANDEAFSLEKTGSGWQVTKTGQQFSATTSSVNGLLGNLQNVKAERIVSKNVERHTDYNVDDSSGTRIELMAGTKKVGDVMVGRFNFNQATRSGISYVRITENPEVFSVDGFLSMSLSQGADNYRDKQLLSLNSDDVTKIDLQQNGSILSYQKLGTQWQDESGASIDSSKMVTYLNNIRTINGGTFANNPEGEMGDKTNTLTIAGNNMTAPVQINVYTSLDTSQHFVIHSSANDEGYFFSDSSGIYQRLVGGFANVRSEEE